MTREEKRVKVINACIAHQQHIANVAKQEMDSAQQQSNDYGANVDRYDSYRTKMMRARDMYAKQLSNANASLRYLQEALRMPPFDHAEHGAIVVTDKQRFFLSIGAGKFVVKDPESATGMQYYFAISAQTPIYQALKGKTIGDSFIVNGILQTIKEIF
ncbi:MAG: hypothetical protein J6T88_07435 [Bacteroidales bacterium]|nr:hypothetical protein [Bacteroidales bacterium]